MSFFFILFNVVFGVYLFGILMGLMFHLGRCVYGSEYELKNAPTLKEHFRKVLFWPAKAVYEIFKV